MEVELEPFLRCFEVQLCCRNGDESIWEELLELIWALLFP